MTRFDRLVLDAVQRLGPETTTRAIYEYLEQRRWWLLGAPIVATYVALRRFENAGWITSRWQDPDGPKPRRRVYSVTTAGAEKL